MSDAQTIQDSQLNLDSSGEEVCNLRLDFNGDEENADVLDLGDNQFEEKFTEWVDDQAPYWDTLEGLI